nr:hypothetical protein [Tanacetum cinerariifolium]
MMIHNIDSNQEVSYIESVSEPQSVGNVCVTPRGSRYWTPVVLENKKPVKKMLFVSLDQAIEFYNNYAKKLDLNLIGHQKTKKDDSHFLNSQRQLNFCQKQTLMDVGNLNMGQRKGFKVLKQARGNLNMGQRKGFKVLKQAREGDVHMAIEKLERKKELFPDFSYEFMQGEYKKLSRLFWADETAKRNYIVFGDIVGFDATFRTQNILWSLFRLSESITINDV